MKQVLISHVVRTASGLLAVAGRALGSEHPCGVLCAETAAGLRLLARELA